MTKVRSIAKLSTAVAKAIDQLHSVVFVAGREPPSNRPELHEAYHVASLVEEGCALRTFQRRGISSKVVAEALRAGVLVAVAKEEGK